MRRPGEPKWPPVLPFWPQLTACPTQTPGLLLCSQNTGHTEACFPLAARPADTPEPETKQAESWAIFSDKTKRYRTEKPQPHKGQPPREQRTWDEKSDEKRQGDGLGLPVGQRASASSLSSPSWALAALSKLVPGGVAGETRSCTSNYASEPHSWGDRIVSVRGETLLGHCSEQHLSAVRRRPPELPQL